MKSAYSEAFVEQARVKVLSRGDRTIRSIADEVVADVPGQREIHVIVDNYSTHKKNHDWLAKHPNVHFH